MEQDVMTNNDSGNEEDTSAHRPVVSSIEALLPDFSQGQS